MFGKKFVGFLRGIRLSFQNEIHEIIQRQKMIRMKTKSTFNAFFLVALSVFLSVEAAANEKVFINSLGMEFIRIPAGTFEMGSPSSDPLRDNREVRHKVTISKDYYMQATEVTLAQWRQLMGKGLFRFFERRKGDPQLPVSRTCFHDAMSFIERLNALGEGRYRLPTEAEWEYAARAGSDTAFSWGDEIKCDNAMFANKSGRFDFCVAYAKERGLPIDGPAPVKSFAPNAWGLYDMHGNVWEWCQDWYAPYAQGPQIDPQGPPTGDYRVRRGGSWFGEWYKCRSANRAKGHPASRLRSTGFRLVMVAQP